MALKIVVYISLPMVKSVAMAYYDFPFICSYNWLFKFRGMRAIEYTSQVTLNDL